MKTRAAALVVVGVVAAGPALAACGGTGMPPQMFTAYARNVQSQLAEHGYDPGQPDGKPGPRTATAVRAYQRDARLTVDGCISKDLAEHLNFAQPKVYARGKGTARTVEREVQEELTRKGYYLGPVDGTVGPATRKAVRAFQADAGLAATGLVDSSLLGVLKKAPGR